MHATDPIARFKTLYAHVLATVPASDNPTAMVVASIGPDGRPSARFVLLKDFDERGFVFYTNLHSRKGREILERPDVALCFYWPSVGEQVRVEGPAERVADTEADEYFATRPRESQIGAWASDQSEPLASYDDLVHRVVVYAEKFAAAPVPRPPHWTGLRVVPERIEFWRSRPDRLHDRELYLRGAEGWTVQRLFP
jgi:pyridoxamine 5'-phosphate oxidase